MILLGMLLPSVGLAEPEPPAAPPAHAQPADAQPEAAADPPTAAPAARPQPADAPPAASSAAAAQPPEDPIVCKTTTKVGTRFATKSCMPRSEWAEMTRKAEEDFATIRNRPVSCPECRD
jgi:hypothetical protein